jgi:hypothetical protein
MDFRFRTTSAFFLTAILLGCGSAGPDASGPGRVAPGEPGAAPYQPWSDPFDPGDPVPAPRDRDDDGDGIPDDEDNIPCRAFTLTVDNEDVSSATVILNGTVVVEQNYFPSTEVLEVFINPVVGENTLSLGGRVAGSPSDILMLAVSDDLATIYLDEDITRNSGTPQRVSLTFDIDVTCEE